VDPVITLVGGLGRLLGEGMLDKRIVRLMEGSTRNHFIFDT